LIFSDRLTPESFIKGNAPTCLSSNWQELIAGVALWGVHRGMTQGLLNAMIARPAPVDLGGTAFGFLAC